MRRTLLTLFFITGLWPGSVSAEVLLNEIMYDLEVGSDSGREWVEIYNNGSETVDLTGWKFFEENTNHGLTASQGSFTLVPSGYAVIVSDVNKFLFDHLGYSGAIFDSSFSLENTGESLALKNANGAIVSEVLYTKDQGGNGDGNSLQLLGGVWRGSTPTPGAANVESSAPANPPPPSPAPPASTGGAAAPSPSPTPPGTGSNTSSAGVTMRAHAGADRTVIVGADAEFSGTLFGLSGQSIDNARFLWNFGDGTFSEGRKVKHRFLYPGDYIVVLDVTSGEHSASDRVMVHARAVQLVIAAIGASYEALEIINPSVEEIDLSWWQVEIGGKKFTLPRNTLILPKGKLILANEVTGFTLAPSVSVTLYFPSGNRAQDIVLEGLGVPQMPVTSNIAPVKANSPVPPTAETKAKNILQQKQTAAVIRADDTDKVPQIEMLDETEENASGSFWYFLAGAALLVVLGAAASFKLKKNPADEYKIIEEPDE